MHERSIAIVTSIHPDFDARVWKHALSLARSGWKVSLICPWDVPTGEVRDGVTIVTFRRVEVRWKRPVLVPLRVFDCLMPLLPHVDIVHFHDIDLLPWMSILAAVKPTVYDVHENYGEEMLVREWIPKRLGRPLAATVMFVQRACSYAVRNVVLVVDSQDVDFAAERLRVHHLLNFATADLAAADDRTVPPSDVVLFTGSSYENNGTLLLLEVASRVRECVPGVRFHVTDRFASSEFRRVVVTEIERRGLQSHVILVPNVPPHELAGVMSSATVAIIPVLRVPKTIRAIPTKLFEFMAAGLPIVASDLPHLQRILNDASCGLLARPEDPAAFADAIVALLRDRELALRLGNNGRRAFLDRYTWESQTPGLIAFYERILRKAD